MPGRGMITLYDTTQWGYTGLLARWEVRKRPTSPPGTESEDKNHAEGYQRNRVAYNTVPGKAESDSDAIGSFWHVQ